MYTATGADSARVRIISAREATRSERRHYQNRRVEVQPNNQVFDDGKRRYRKFWGKGGGKINHSNQSTSTASA